MAVVEEFDVLAGLVEVGQDPVAQAGHHHVRAGELDRTVYDEAPLVRIGLRGQQRQQVYRDGARPEALQIHDRTQGGAIEGHVAEREIAMGQLARSGK